MGDQHFDKTCRSLAAHPNADLAALVGWDGTVSTLDFETLDWRTVRKIPDHTFESVSWSNDGTLLVVADKLGHVLRWNSQTVSSTISLGQPRSVRRSAP